MAGSTIVIRYDGTDITDYVLFAQSSFSARANAVPGEARLRLKDTARTLSFVTGREITLDVDGVRLWGGYLMQVNREHAFPADDTTNVSTYRNRMWELRAVDYNALFDRRVIRNPSNYLGQLPTFTIGSAKDGTLLRTLLANYIDVPAGFDINSEMDDVAYVGGDLTNIGRYHQQGTKLREQFQTFAKWSAAVWYISADKKFHWHGLEDVEQSWGFSDQPNLNPITQVAPFQNAYFPFREVSALEDGGAIVNDAIVWGGSEWSGSGSTVYYRAQDSASQTNHGRWQMGETNFGDGPYAVQAGVTARANAIVFGAPGANALGQQKGLRYSQWTFRFAWFAHDVPFLSGSRYHVKPGALVWVNLNTFGVTKLLPCRNLAISFPGLDPDGNAYVRFEAEFALNQEDPFQLWAYLLGRQRQTRTPIQTTVTNGSTTTPYGSIGHFTPSPTPNGSATLFTLPFGYIQNTLQVYLNGLLQRPGTDYTETSNTAGTFTMTTAPDAADNLYVICLTLAG